MKKKEDIIKHSYKEAYIMGIIYLFLGIAALIPWILFKFDLLIMIIIGFILIILGIFHLIFTKRVVITDLKVRKAGLLGKLISALPIAICLLILSEFKITILSYISVIGFLIILLYAAYIIYKAYKITAHDPSII